MPGPTLGRPWILAVVVTCVYPIAVRFFKDAWGASKLEICRFRKNINWDKLNLHWVPFTKHRYSHQPSNKKKTSFSVLLGLVRSTRLHQHVGLVGMFPGSSVTTSGWALTPSTWDSRYLHPVPWLPPCKGFAFPPNVPGFVFSAAFLMLYWCFSFLLTSLCNCWRGDALIL